jgi:two-component system LytT family response regulator
MRDVLRAVIVDDEPLARDNVRLVLASQPVEWVAECGLGEEAIREIVAGDPDLVFLDIDLPDMDGFEVLGRLPAERRPAVVFVTAYREHAVEAFEVHAVDYVVKPFSEERLVAALERARSRIERGEVDGVWDRLAGLVDRLDGGEEPPDTGLDTPSPPARRILVGDSDRQRFVPVDEVDWLEADGNYVRLHGPAGTPAVRSTLTGLLERLDPATFVRIHRGTVVNLDRVREIQPWFAGRYVVLMADGTELRVSRGYRDRLLRLTL